MTLVIAAMCGLTSSGSSWKLLNSMITQLGRDLGQLAEQRHADVAADEHVAVRPLEDSPEQCRGGLLPLDPVMPRIGAGQSSKKQRVPRTDRDVTTSRASASSGSSGGTPGLTNTTSASSVGSNGWPPSTKLDRQAGQLLEPVGERLVPGAHR